MSAYDNVVVGKLRLKGKALDVNSGGNKKKNKQRKQYDYNTDKVGILKEEWASRFCSCRGNKAVTNLIDAPHDEGGIEQKHEEAPKYDHLTPAERKYLQQWEKINLKRLTKEATKSHRDRIQEFNQYLANLSEHYDIPKVGPG